MHRNIFSILNHILCVLLNLHHLRIGLLNEEGLSQFDLSNLL